MDANVIDWYGKDNGRTQFEVLLDETDKALQLRMFLATRDQPHYNHDAYQQAATLTLMMFDMICGDQDLSDEIENLWLDCNESIRYILTMMFEEARWDAVHKATDELSAW